jgi:two-component system CheB/CheR fusion protein
MDLHDEQQGLPMLLDMIYRTRGWDLSGYKKTSLGRRISKALTSRGVSSYEEYRRVLEDDPAEYERLFSTVTVKVSEFFREPEVFERLGDELRPFAAEAGGVKAWSCGCAHGEEAYSLAILLSERLGADALQKTRVFATDIDAAALDQARRGVYRDESVRNVDPARMARHFLSRRMNGLHRVGYDIRNLVKFGALDMVRAPSISGVHALLCRNVFIYFGKPLQEAVFAKLDYALRPGGLMVLGRAEVVPAAFSSGYSRLAYGMSIYRKRPLP